MSRNISAKEAIDRALEPTWEDRLYFPYICRNPEHRKSRGKCNMVCCSKSPCGRNVFKTQMWRHIELCRRCWRIIRKRRHLNVRALISTDASSDDGGLCLCHCKCHSQDVGKVNKHAWRCCQMAPCGSMIKTGALQFHIDRCESCRVICG